MDLENDDATLRPSECLQGKILESMNKSGTNNGSMVVMAR